MAPLLADGPRSEPERWLLAAAHLALGDTRTGEHLIEAGSNQPGKTVVAPQAPLPALLYARALPVAGDLPENRVTQLLQAAHAATLRAWPRAWEALAGQALLAVRHHGPVEGEIQALAEIARARARISSLDPALLALQSNLAARSELRDLAAATFAELARPLAGTPLLAHLDRVVQSRVGAEQEAFLCGAPALARYSTDCLNARVARGDRTGALAEIQRLRALWPAPDSLLRAEIVQRLALGENQAALALYDRTLPAHRPVGLLAGLFAEDPRGLRERLARDVPATAEDPAGALAAFTSLLGESPAPAWEAESPGRVAADRRHSAATGAATLVLAHRESYAFEASGLLRYTLYDLRRVSGTADVDRPDEVAPQGIWGRELRRSLRRRIFKPDGRVLDPEPRVGQRQGRTDLSQLEPGDYLEEITQGFSLPASTGQIFVMTQHLLPARTSVQEATVEIRRPAGLSLPLWAHPLLGRPVISRRGGEVVTRFSLAGAAPRRLETNVPTGDQSVAVYLATTPWQASGAMLAETIAALEDGDPLVAGWARTLEPPAGSSDRDRIAAVVTAVGQTIKRANPTTLIDTDWASPRTQRSTARTILELGDGSRSWLAYRALRELGLPVEILVAEEEPLSADPRYPHRFGRFRHPLLAVQIRGEKTPLWLDLDVRGPPLPPGRISPQLRGRQAVDTSGRIRPLPGSVTGDQPTLLGLDLKLDDQGTARGTFTAALRGREAQVMADELPYLVGQRRDQRLRAVVLGWLPSATVNEVALVSQEGSPEVSLRAGVELPGYGQAEGAAWSLPGIEPLHNLYAQLPVATLGSTFAKHRVRESALAIDDAVSYRLHRRVELPAPARLQGEQPALALREPHISATRRIAMNEHAPIVEERFELENPDRRAGPAPLPALRRRRRPDRPDLPGPHPGHPHARPPLTANRSQIAWGTAMLSSTSRPEIWSEQRSTSYRSVFSMKRLRQEIPWCSQSSRARRAKTLRACSSPRATKRRRTCPSRSSVLPSGAPSRSRSKRPTRACPGGA